MAKSIFLLGIALTLFSAQSFSQATKSAEIEQSLTPAVCMWDMAGMYELPGKDAPYLGKITLGQEVQMMTDSFLVESEGKMYQKIKSPQGSTAWVDKSKLVENATPVALIADAPIYQVAGEATTISNQNFSAGEVAAMKDFQEGWIMLVGQEKKKKGWVRWEKGEEILSVTEGDLKIAVMLQQAKQKEDPVERINALEAIRREPDFYGSALNQVVLKEMEQKAPTSGFAPPPASTQPSPGTRDLASALAAYPGQPEAANPPSATTSMAATGVASRGINDIQTSEDAGQPVVDALPTGGTITREKVHDTETGINYVKVTEMGEVLAVSGPTGRENLYFAYHKTLPKGARILLNIPDNPGFVELTVISRLSETRSQIVGLHPKIIEAVFGSEVRDPQAQIIYFIRQ